MAGLRSTCYVKVERVGSGGPGSPETGFAWPSPRTQRPWAGRRGLGVPCRGVSTVPPGYYHVSPSFARTRGAFISQPEECMIFFFFPPLDEVKYFLKVSRAGGTRRPRSGRARSVEGAMWTRSWSPAAPDLVEGSKPGPGRRREDRPQPVGRDSRMRPPGTRHVTVVLNKLRFFCFFFLAWHH